MEVKIGIQQAQRELVIDLEDEAAAIEEKVAKAVADDGLLSLTDAKGRKVLVPIGKLAYVEIGSGVVGQVGFRS